MGYDRDHNLPECDWFAGCHNVARNQVEHPTLGWVDICDEHVSWLGDSPSPTQFVPPIAAKHQHRLAALLARADDGK